MESLYSSLAAKIRADVLPSEGVTKFAPNRRFATIFLEGSVADTVFFVDSGLAKLFKRGDENKEIILDVAGSGRLFGMQGLTGTGPRNASAELLQEGLIYSIPYEAIARAAKADPDLWHLIAMTLLDQKNRLEKKVELLCLRDVEYRILYYLRELSITIGTKQNGKEHSIPLSQGELASLIGATRETTSTTLNTLARRGLIRLGRRQLIVLSPDEVLATNNEGQPARANARSV